MGQVTTHGEQATMVVIPRPGSKRIGWIIVET
jgi:hypothetical protein